MAFVHPRTIRFQDTDAAGVVYFATVLTICHEAYEASLAAMGVDLPVFFGGSAIAVPIAHASVDFFRPMRCGDRLDICLTPTQTSPSEFEITYQIVPAAAPQKPLSTALTRHVCIESATRRRQDLPDFLTDWLSRWTDAPAPSA